MSDYTKMTIEETLSKVAKASPAPGGGAIAALSGAEGAALAGMAAGFTIGKKGYENISDEMTAIKHSAKDLREKLLALVNRDAEAYTFVINAYRLPKESTEEKQKRTKAIQEALFLAAKVPLETMKYCKESGALLQILAERGYEATKTDAAVGMLMIMAGAEGAYRNVMINLESIKDENILQDLKSEADLILDECREMNNMLRKNMYND